MKRFFCLNFLLIIIFSTCLINVSAEESAVTISKVSNVIDGLRISWNRIDNSSDFVLMKKTSDVDNWQKISVIKQNQNRFIDKHVLNGVKYSYSIVQKNTTDFSDVTVFEKTRVETVSDFNVKNSPNGVTLRWKKPTNSKNYIVFRKVEGEKSFLKIASLKSNKSKFIDKSAKFGKKNTYFIQVISKENLKSAYSKKEYVYAVNPKKKMIALTYDDGPAGESSKIILDTLEKYNARATFFVLGSRISSYSSTLKREAKLGCEIACHTYNHVTLTSASDTKIKSEISKTNKLIKKYTSKDVKLVRAPGGAQNERVRNAAGFPMIGWSIDTRDWEHRNSTKSYNCVANYAKDGAIVLMHDIHSPTATASKSIIPYLIKKGYQLVTVSEMFDAKGIKMKNNGYYYSAS